MKKRYIIFILLCIAISFICLSQSIKTVFIGGIVVKDREGISFRKGMFERHDDKVLSIPEGIQKIGVNALSNNSLVEEVILPSSLEIIDDYAFENFYAFK